ncbi:hypothetical protein KAH27_04715 [bacterium]|nr:hypothetical protein [bacterium]
MKGLIIILLLSLNIFAVTEKVDLQRARMDVSAKLSSKKISVINLATNLCKSKPGTAQEAIFNLFVFMQAGMTDEAVNMLHEVKNSAATISEYQINSIYYDACNFKDWDVAKAIESAPVDSESSRTAASILGHELYNDINPADPVLWKWLSERPKWSYTAERYSNHILIPEIGKWQKIFSL